MPDLFARGNKVFVEEEIPENSIPVGEDVKAVFSEAGDDIVQSELQLAGVFSEGKEGNVIMEKVFETIEICSEDSESICGTGVFDIYDVFTDWEIKYVYVFTGDDMTVDQRLAEWAQGKDYQPLTINYDIGGNVTDASVKWPDDAVGTLTMTDWNATHGIWDGYNITHSTSGKTVTQPAVTRNAGGDITIKPALIIA